MRSQNGANQAYIAGLNGQAGVEVGQGEFGQSCCGDEDPPSVGEIIAATIRGWWSSIFGGGRDDVETLAENGLVEEAQQLEEQIEGTVAFRTKQLKEYQEAISIIPGMSFAEGAQQTGEGNYLAAGISMALFISEMLPEVGQASKQAGTVVIGHYPDYVKLGKQLKAKIFTIPTKIWNNMSEVDRWSANLKFLDRIISRGDNVRLATPLNKIKQGSYLEKEVNYLLDNGYKTSKNGKWLIKN